MSPCQRVLIPVVLTCLLVATAEAAAVLEPLDPARPAAPALAASVVDQRPDGLTLRLEVGQLSLDTVRLAGREWTALALQDGALEGAPGEPALPVWTTLLAVPEGAALTVGGAAGRLWSQPGLDLAPLPNADGTLAAADLREPSARLAAPDLVSVGRPARMAGVTVVPLVVRPVAWNPATRTATVADRVDVQLAWQGGTPPARALPASMQAVLAGTVLNWPDQATRLGDPAGTPGTWVAVLPSSAYAGLVQPLVDWRRRQGYHVVVTDLNTTGPSAANVRSYLQQLYQTVEPPLEFVTLVGDGSGSVAVPTWREDASGLHGEGDHPYTLLDGDDQLPDVHVGRLSCLTPSQLSTIVAKIVAYETNPPRDDPAWFRRGVVVGDPTDSGITTVFAARWVAERLYGIGFERVDQIYAGDFATSMFNSLNDGRSVFAYRGFYGVSGFTSGHASVLTNGGRLPFALFPTCDSSSWLLDPTARSEAFLRNANGGAIGAIGTATSGTHTRYNNCLFYGTMEGLLNSDEHRQGAALSRGKLELYRNYIVNEPDVVEIWSTWNTLMGDPATDIWLAEPAELTVTHPAAVPAEATAIAVEVADGDGPLAGALVAATSGTAWRAVARTDAEGRVLLPLDAGLTGAIRLTVSGHDLLPYLGTVDLAAQDHWVAFDGLVIDGDGVANPAEDLALAVDLRNVGQQPVSGLQLTVTSESPWLSVLDGPQVLGNLAVGAAVTAPAPVHVAVSALAPDGAACSLRITATSNEGSWDSQAVVPLVAPELDAVGLAFTPGPPVPGLSTELVVTLANTGSLPLAGGQAVLRSRSLWVTIEDSTASFGAIAVGGQGDHAADPFALSFAADMVAGASVPLSVVVEQADGLRRRVDLLVQVGERTLVDPVGPDTYGYYAFDNGDVGYAEARPFDWVEIDPSRGGPGADVGLTDTYYERDDTETVPLPFPFRYYGESFGSVSICSNGWIAFGETTHTFWRNWIIPSAGSPDAMVAVFWDDLVQQLANKVYHWYDAAEHRYIVQWSRMRNQQYGLQTCQVILLDPAFHPTRSGDGIIVCQYLDLDDNDDERSYATLGIQSPDGTDGVCYAYYHGTAPGAPPLAPGLAITYLPVGRREPVTCEVSPETLSVSLPVGGAATHTLHVANAGEEGPPLAFAILQRDPTVLGQPARSMLGCTASLAESTYEPGAPTTLHLALYNGSPDNEWIAGFTLDLPAGVSLIGGTDLLGDDGHRLFWQGGSGEGVSGNWLGQGADMINQFATATGTVTIVVDYGLGDVELPWLLTGDNYGGDPHAIAGSFALAASGNLLNLLSPDGGEAWSLGEVRAFTWEHSPDVAAISLDLSRDGGATWEVIATDVPAATGAFDWLVGGPVSGLVRARITSLANPLVTDSSTDPFIIQNDLSWLTVNPAAGEVPGGDTVDVALVFSAAGLAAGTYEQVLVIDNSLDLAISVPISLIVGEATPATDLPAVTSLAQNVPNPFNPRTTIAFTLAERGPADLAVFDLSGRRVAQLVRGEQPAGAHTVLWDGHADGGRPLASGTYVYRLVTARGSESRKLVLVK
ncbi:MAG: C25 family cysteine peptidase [Candidatus Krumholzibacteriia bacterium]